MNRQELMAAADARDIVRMIAPPGDFREHGGRMYLRCPVHAETTGHEDRNLGNCVVRAHFREGAGETMEQKIKRMIRTEVANMNFAV
ncbi:MAG: transposon-encoded TnpW family protein [Lachnospiraceae bacterium]|nr:transposon-encoded TnpW family protein [Lachnospiraceae bacterium]